MHGFPTCSTKSCFLSSHQSCGFQECSFPSETLAHSSLCFLGTSSCSSWCQVWSGKASAVMRLGSCHTHCWWGHNHISRGWSGVFADNTQPWTQVMMELLKFSLIVSWDDVSVEGYELVAIMYQLSSIQSLSSVWLFATSWTAARQAYLSITNSRSPPKYMSIELVIPSSHLILCRPLLLLPSVFPNIRLFSNELALHNKWPKYWSFSFNISPSNEYSGFISFRIDTPIERNKMRCRDILYTT